MPIELPEDRKEIFDRMKNDVRAAVPKANPFLRNSVIGGFIFGISGRVFDFFSQIKVLLQELFMDTATGAFLDRWGSYKGIFREAASIAEGPITIGGIVGSIIPNGTDENSEPQVKPSKDTPAFIKTNKGKIRKATHGCNASSA